MSNKCDIFEQIEKKGVRLTSQRTSIVEVFIENQNSHLSANNIYDLLKEEDNSLGLATIYRTLNLLEDKEIVARRDFGDETTRYEFVLNRIEHNHLICKKCSKVIEIENILPENIYSKLLAEEGFLSSNHSVKIYGLCMECRNNIEDSALN